MNGLIKIFVTAIVFMAAVVTQVSAKTTYIYENTNNKNYHMHAVYDVPGGVRVAWFQVKPYVKTLGQWRCGDYNRRLKCKEPNNIIQYFNYSSDLKWFYSGTTKYRLIKTVKQ